MIEVTHTAHTSAARDAVWALLADLEGWHTWGPWASTTLDGEIRTLVSERKRLSGKPYVMRERVLALQPPDRMRYGLLSGLPVRNYTAEVELHDAAGGTDITWKAFFDPPWPLFGGLWRGAMTKVVRDVSEALAAAADRSR